MISLVLAQQLRQAGLAWHPAERDMFAVPNSPLDQQVFVVSQLTALVQMYNGNPVVTFHGSSEWALDYVLVNEVVWLPSEGQLREDIGRRIGSHAPLRLDRTTEGYRCTLGVGDRVLEFDSYNAADTYALALLHILSNIDAA